MSYIARCSLCNGILMAIVDKPERRDDVAREVSTAIMSGDIVERVTIQFVRDNWSDCTCDAQA